MYSVIVVEDEDIIRNGIVHSVPWEKYKCKVIGEAGNGAEGKTAITELKPDIVIADINMPVINGLQMIEETRCSFDYVSIILTGYSDFEYAQQAIRNGVSAYVLKPLDMEEMGEALERAVLECDNIRLIQEQNQQHQNFLNQSIMPERKNNTEDLLVQTILDYIAAKYTEKITISDLENTTHYSERSMNQRFQKETGTTVIEYLNRYRIQKAIGYLKNAEMQISDIGWKCGIGEYKYFSHVFKKYIGCSPREFKNKMQ